MSAPADLERQEIKRLIALMKDPRYWRDHDPDVRRVVRSGFKQLYGTATMQPPRPPGATAEVQSAA